MQPKILSALFLLGIVLFFNSCKEDELPKSTLEFDQDQFDEGELNVFESNGTVNSFHPLLYNNAQGVLYEVEINLNRPVAETTVIRYSTSGSATRSTSTSVGDFDIETDGDLLVIEKGESSATLPVRIFEDYEFEFTSPTEVFQSFTITLEEVVTGTGVIGENSTFDVFIYEDDMIVFLDWDPQDDATTGSGNVDMDLLVWVGNEQLTASDATGPDPEAVNIPAGLANAQYGFSYTYFSGTSNDLDFSVEFINFGGNINGNPENKLYTKTYTLDNKNEYTTSGILPFVAQTTTKSGFNYINLTDITVNPNGSRVETGLISIPRGELKKQFQRLDKQRILELKKLKGL